MEFLSLESLSHIVGVEPNVLRTWIEDFNVYIPKTNLDNVTYYLPGAINVLKFIKHLNDEQYDKHQTREKLAHSPFPVRLENVQEEYIEERQSFYASLMNVIKQQTAEIDQLKRDVNTLKQIVSAEAIEADPKVKS